ncbi:MAG: hypothetical protein LBT04_06065 [Prevotellaceae bacterium]|nr:hypothetical protein [Prevotellaceae bacterium]
MNRERIHCSLLSPTFSSLQAERSNPQHPLQLGIAGHTLKGTGARNDAGLLRFSQ